MRVRGADADGFSLIEVVIAMVLLGVIAVAIIPVMWQGLIYSSQQSTVATATRQLYALVEAARETPNCSTLVASATTQSFTDGADQTFTTAGTAGPCYPCASAVGITVPLSLTATQGTRSLAEVSALVFVPAAKTSSSCP